MDWATVPQLIEGAETGWTIRGKLETLPTSGQTTCLHMLVPGLRLDWGRVVLMPWHCYGVYLVLSL